MAPLERFTVEPTLVWPGQPRHQGRISSHRQQARLSANSSAKIRVLSPAPYSSTEIFGRATRRGIWRSPCSKSSAVSPRNVVNEGCPSYSMKPIQRIRHVLLRTRFEFESHVLQDGLDVRRKRTIRASTLDVFWAKYIMRPI